MTKTVRFSDQEPTWASVMTRLRTLGEQPILRMIDGLPAFPDEVPAEGWRELRVSVTGGMVTIRRGPGEWQCIAWGNADDAARQGWETVARACTEATSSDTPNS